MTDLAIVVVILAYAGLGYWTGLVRRVIGLLGLYLAYFAATASGPTAAGVVLQALPTWSVPDALMLGYFGVVVILVVVIEVIGTFYHSQVQLRAILFDRISGVVLGVLTALVGLSVGLSLLLGAAQPVEGSPDGAQIQIHDSIRRAVLAPVLIGSLGPAVKPLFGAVIPASPGAYFNGQQAQVQH